MASKINNAIRHYKVFLDTSALIAGIASSRGAAWAVLQLAEIGLIEVFVSRQVIVEADRNIENKLPEMLIFLSLIIIWS